MARELDDFPAERRQPLRRHPWEDWSNGRAWELVAGEDFDEDIEVFRNRFYPQARRRGGKFETVKRLQVLDDRAWRDATVHEVSAAARGRLQLQSRTVLIVRFYKPLDA